MKKRLTSLLLSVVLALAAFSPAYATPQPTTNFNALAEGIQQENATILNDIMYEIPHMLNITNDITDGIIAAINVGTNTDEYYNIILSSDVLIQQISLYYDEILNKIQPYEELNTASALLQLAKESLPSTIESSTAEAESAWLRSLANSCEWVSTFSSVMADICRKYGI